MSREIALRCRCGRVRAVAADVAPETTCRCICYCRDCRAFAHFLGRPDLLDVAGGSEIVQLARSSIRVDAGSELGCVRLSAKGMFRWYAPCCRTPIGNTVVSIPFVGLAQSFIDPSFDLGSLGPALLVNTGSPLAPLPPHPRVPIAGVWKTLKLVGSWWLRDRGKASAFFDASGQPVVVPTVLDRAQRLELGKHPQA